MNRDGKRNRHPGPLDGVREPIFLKAKLKYKAIENAWAECKYNTVEDVMIKYVTEVSSFFPTLVFPGESKSESGFQRPGTNKETREEISTRHKNSLDDSSFFPLALPNISLKLLPRKIVDISFHLLLYAFGVCLIDMIREIMCMVL